MASREVLRGAFDTIYPAAVSRGQPARDPMVEIQEIRHDRKASASAPASACGVGLRTGWGAVRAWDCDPGQPVHSWIHVELRSKQGLARRAMRPVVFLYPLDTR